MCAGNPTPRAAAETTAVGCQHRVGEGGGHWRLRTVASGELGEVHAPAENCALP